MPCRLKKISFPVDKETENFLVMSRFEIIIKNIKKLFFQFGLGVEINGKFFKSFDGKSYTQVDPCPTKNIGIEELLAQCLTRHVDSPKSSASSLTISNMVKKPSINEALQNSDRFRNISATVTSTNFSNEHAKVRVI